MALHQAQEHHQMETAPPGQGSPPSLQGSYARCVQFVFVFWWVVLQLRHEGMLVWSLWGQLCMLDAGNSSGAGTRIEGPAWQDGD